MSNLRTLDWHVPSAFPSRHIRMRSSLSGTERPKFCLVPRSIPRLLISGQSDAFLPRWLNAKPCSSVTPKSTRSLKYSRSRAHPASTTGRRLSNIPTSNRASPSGKAYRWRTTSRIWTRQRSTFSHRWWLSNPTSASRAVWLWSTLTSRTWTSRSSPKCEL